MNQQRTNFKHGVLRVLALALITLALVAGLAVVVSADPPTALTVDASHLAFTDESGISVTSGGVITKTYDGSAAIALADVTVNKTAVGIPAGKDVTVNVTEAAWDSAAAGTRHVTVKFELDGADKDEFVIANPSASFTGSIAPYALSWAAGNATATADYAIGKTAEELRATETKTNEEGHNVFVDEALYASVSISIDGMINVIAKAAENALA